MSSTDDDGDYYQLLGVKDDAQVNKIRKVYRKRVKKYAKVKQLVDKLEIAKRVLTNVSERKKYDRELAFKRAHKRPERMMDILNRRVLAVELRCDENIEDLDGPPRPKPREELAQEILVEAANTYFPSMYRSIIEISWSSPRFDYKKVILRQIFKKYGKIKGLVVNHEECKALVEYETCLSKDWALNVEKGYKNRPLELQDRSFLSRTFHMFSMAV